MKFSSLQIALMWTYETCNKPVIKLSAAVCGTGELTAYDRRAQAAMILGRCERVLPALHMAYIRVQFGREASGFDLLVRHLTANFGAGMHSRRGVEQIIRAYCGQKIGLREIRKSMACGMLKSASLRNHGYDALDLIHSQAMEILSEELSEYFNVEGAAK